MRGETGGGGKERRIVFFDYLLHYRKKKGKQGAKALRRAMQLSGGKKSACLSQKGKGEKRTIFSTRKEEEQRSKCFAPGGTVEGRR